MGHDTLDAMTEDYTHLMVPLKGSEVTASTKPHPRFAQVHAWIDGTHPFVMVGQVWENLDFEEGDSNGKRQVRVVKIEGTDVYVVNVNIDGAGALANIGHSDILDVLDFRSHNSGQSGWRILSAIVPVDAAGKRSLNTPIPPRQESLAQVAKKHTPAPKPVDMPSSDKSSSGKQDSSTVSIGKTAQPTSQGTPTSNKVTFSDKKSSPSDKVQTADGRTLGMTHASKVKHLAFAVSNGSAFSEFTERECDRLLNEHGFLPMLRTIRQLKQSEKYARGNSMIGALKEMLEGN